MRSRLPFLAGICLALSVSCRQADLVVRPVAAAEALVWLEAAIDTTEDGAVLVRERYDLQERRWISLYRPDCNVETAYAFLRAWEQTGDNHYLELARAIYRSIAAFQNPDGSFPFADRKDRHVYTNDNSEVPIFLMRMARLDAEYAPRYLETARKGADFLAGIQNDDGSWRVVDNDDSRNAMFTAHAVAALSMAAAAFPDRAEYERAVENGIAFIRTQVLPSGRVRTCCEVHPGTEYWRPPSSDQAITVRGIAMAEYYLPDNPHIDGWKDLRRTLLGWLDLLADGSGALRNGLGEGINSADLPDLTDNATMSILLPSEWRRIYGAGWWTGILLIERRSMAWLRSAPAICSTPTIPAPTGSGAAPITFATATGILPPSCSTPARRVVPR